MSHSIPGRRRVREYTPPLLRRALQATRLANANWNRCGGSGTRYMVDCNIHESVDPDNVWIVDSFEDEQLISVTELLERLPEDLRKQALHSYL